MRPWEARAPLSTADSRAFRREAIFSCGKWDPQVGDAPAWVDFPLVLAPEVWSELAARAELLARETLALEAEILGSPSARELLGLPSAVLRALRSPDPLSPAVCRVMRFDFHPAEEGFCVSEVNSDVPGGFIEASSLTRLLAAHHSDCEPCGDPLAAVAAAFHRRFPEASRIGLVHATAYTDDRQAMIALERVLTARGLRPILLSPGNLRFEQGRALSAAGWDRGGIDGIFRFFPAEWLPKLPGRTGYRAFFRGGSTPSSNPAWAIASQSKRFGVAVRTLGSAGDAWQRLQPETRDPREVPAGERDSWVLKPALGRVGESIGMAGVTPARNLLKIERWARWFPRAWAAQRRFRALPVETAHGLRYPCLGVYVVDGRAAGIYGRIAARPLIDESAQDIVVLVRRDPEPGITPRQAC